MSDEVFEVSAGGAIMFIVTLEDSDGVVIDSHYPGGGYSGAEPLGVKVWTGGRAPANLTTPATWADHAAGTVLISLSSAQTATLSPGRYKVLLQLQDAADMWVDAYSTLIAISPAPSP